MRLTLSLGELELKSWCACRCRLARFGNITLLAVEGIKVMYQGDIEGAQTASNVAARIAIGCEGVNTFVSCLYLGVDKSRAFVPPG